MKRIFYTATCIFLFIFMAPLLCKSKRPKVGNTAPNFTLQNEKGNKISLEDFHGKNLVAVMFYPSANSHFCTKQIRSVVKEYDQLKEKNIVVLGISYNTPEINQEFIEKNNVAFSLLYDVNKEVTKAYGTYSWWFGWRWPSRKTFLIDKDGIIVDIIRKVDINKHAQQIIDGFNF